MARATTILPLLLAVLLWPVAAFARPPLVLAAASLQESLNAAADAWAGRNHERPVLSFAASSALARQVEAGAPADIYISADEDWMDAVAAQGLLRPASRVDLVGNRLVLIAPGPSLQKPAVVGRHFALARMLGNGRLAMADPDAVPAGKYGRAALQSLGLWATASKRIAPAENVRAALLLVARGEAPLGIVYATDAKASNKVHVVAIFDAKGHPPIRYPIAVLNSATSRDAEPFRRFLLSRAGRAIFARFGFSVPHP